MKLYSRGQVIFFSLLSGLAAALFILGFGLPVQFPGKTGFFRQKQPVVVTDTFADDDFFSSGFTEPVIQSSDIHPEQPIFEPKPVQSRSQYNEDERENISVYERLNSAVVNITTETLAYNWFFEPVPQEGGSGSGSIIDARGYILTNNHVIRNAHKLFINLADGSQYEGTVVGSDPENDLAVIKFDPPRGTELRIIPYGDSGSLKVGQKVLAIGNPFALERTLTVGIVSGLGRPIRVARDYVVRDMIQTDALINPGNSGGPLLDTQGRMIGINTMINTTAGGSAAFGFAVPVSTAKRVVPELIQFGKVRRGWFDAEMVQLFPNLVRYAKLPVSSGILISRTHRGGLAEKAGLKQGSDPVQSGRSTIYLGGDIITSVDGEKIGSMTDLYSALENRKPGDKVKVGVVRGTGSVTVEVTLADREEVMGR